MLNVRFDPALSSDKDNCIEIAEQGDLAENRLHNGGRDRGSSVIEHGSTD